ncbi:MAG TPA: M23 family metallopeptidase, partial [Terrimesophilobacter sp.]|nr:M23 family metallopeptidase [Terrimesophilobacter sp.]
VTPIVRDASETISSGAVGPRITRVTERHLSSTGSIRDEHSTFCRQRSDNPDSTSHNGRMPLPRTRPIRLVGLVATLALVGPLSWSATPPAAGAAPSAISQRWHWPVDPPWRVLKPFVAPATPYGPGHRGIDIASFAGAAVYAPTDGTVYFVGVVVDRPVLSIRHPGGLVSSFEPVVSSLSPGDVVRRGERTGTLVPGHCPQTCLHFGVRLNGQYLSPLKFLSGIPHSVLLPVRPLP